MQDSQIEEKLKSFVCQQCQACCRQPGFVYLSDEDADRAAAYLKLESREFIENYCEVEDRRKLVLKKESDEACIFLDAEGCSIHAAKPKQCLDFPLKWRTPKSFEYCEGMKRIGL